MSYDFQCRFKNIKYMLQKGCFLLSQLYFREGLEISKDLLCSFHLNLQLRDFFPGSYDASGGFLCYRRIEHQHEEVECMPNFSWFLLVLHTTCIRKIFHVRSLLFLVWTNYLTKRCLKYWLSPLPYTLYCHFIYKITLFFPNSVTLTKYTNI